MERAEGSGFSRKVNDRAPLLLSRWYIHRQNIFMRSIERMSILRIVTGDFEHGIRTSSDRNIPCRLRKGRDR
jgi:hypothetical protein